MTETEIVRQIEALERRVERRLAAAMAPISETLHRIEQKVDKTNGRVTGLEKWRIAREAAEGERVLAAKEAAALVAQKAEAAVQARERSRKWKATVISTGFAAITVGTPLMGALLRHLHVIHS